MGPYDPRNLGLATGRHPGWPPKRKFLVEYQNVGKDTKWAMSKEGVHKLHIFS